MVRVFHASMRQTSKSDFNASQSMENGYSMIDFSVYRLCPSFLRLLHFLTLIIPCVLTSWAQPISSDSTEYVQYRDARFRFSICYPKSWAKVEASLPETCFKAVSDNGRGGDDMSVVAVKSDSILSMRPEEYVKSINSNTYMDAIRKIHRKALLLDHGSTTLGNQPAYYFVMDITYSALDINVTMRNLQLLTLCHGVAYTVTFRTSPDDFQNMYDLFQLISSSLVFWPDVQEVLNTEHNELKDQDAAYRAVFSKYLYTAFILGTVIIVCLIIRKLFVRQPMSILVAAGIIAPIWSVFMAISFYDSKSAAPEWITAAAMAAFLIFTSKKSVAIASIHSGWLTNAESSGSTNCGTSSSDFKTTPYSKSSSTSANAQCLPQDETTDIQEHCLDEINKNNCARKSALRQRPFGDHKVWWLCLYITSTLYSIIVTPNRSSPGYIAYILGAGVGWLLLPFVIGGTLWLSTNGERTTHRLMNRITAVWLVLITIHFIIDGLHISGQ